MTSHLFLDRTAFQDYATATDLCIGFCTLVQDWIANADSTLSNAYALLTRIHRFPTTHPFRDAQHRTYVLSTGLVEDEKEEHPQVAFVQRVINAVFPRDQFHVHVLLPRDTWAVHWTDADPKTTVHATQDVYVHIAAIHGPCEPPLLDRGLLLSTGYSRGFSDLTQYTLLDTK